MALLDFIRNLTGITTYDSSDSVVIVANKYLSDFTKVTITTTEVNKLESGVDVNYQIPVSIAPTTTISISLLPESEDKKFLNDLQDYLQMNGGYFQITISNGDKYAGTYSCFFIKETDTDVDIEPEDYVFEFGAIREDRGSYRRLPSRNTDNNRAGIPQGNGVVTYPYEI